MLTHQNVKTISDMREDAKGLLEHVKKEGATYIFYRSKPEGVLLSILEFNKLREMAEDYIDSVKAQEYTREDKSKAKWYSHEDVLEKLGLTQSK
ncbi:MAG: hypothetical protein Q8P72_03620 [Candidatus Roizmanbacteria bacterium]|nr:hypothetical protein [Candidatus Roizmanbacteria bacterium]